MSNNKILGGLQKLGKALMTPVAVLPAAGLLLRFGQGDLLNLAWMAQAGNAIFNNLPLIFSIGIAVGLAEENNGVAALAATVGYFVLTNVAVTFNKTIDMGVLAGVISGVLAAYLYNKYKTIKVPDFLGFFGGKRFVPIITSLYSLVLGVISGYVWPMIQGWISALGNFIIHSGSIGAFIYGFLNRMLIPFGLHHIINTMIWFQFGDFKDASGKIVHGEITRFFAHDPNAGAVLAGFFPIMMFALPAACLAMISAAKKENRKAVSGMLIGIAFTSFLTGITEPIEFSFMFLAPGLYFVHALLTGAAVSIAAALGMRDAFSFSAGAIDYILNFNIAAKPIAILILGLVFGVIYYFVFLFCIKKFDLPTPGRLEEETAQKLTGLNNKELKEKAALILDAIGTSTNIDSIDACVTRIRLTAIDPSKVDEKKLKEIGATGVMKMGEKNFQIVVGTVADIIVTYMKGIMKK